MEIRKIGGKYDVTIVYQRNGNDRNGNPIYLINIFQGNNNTNWGMGEKWKRDKYGNIRVKTYNIYDVLEEIAGYFKD